MQKQSANEAYQRAGVNLEAGYESVQRIKSHIRMTKRPEVLSDIGGFGGMFQLMAGKYKEPVLVSGTDGVGTKLKLAFLMDKHDTIGQDCVAMCVNDIVCSGAEPLFFLDYIACGKNEPAKIEQIVKGVAGACAESNCSLVGGETAEMPGFYPVDEYDLAGFAVGVGEKEKMMNFPKLEEGDAIIALPSTGVHSNGFSLVRNVFNIDDKDEKKVKGALNTEVEELGKTLGELLLEPTALYVRPILRLFEECTVKGVAHITGGGFYENIPRMISEESNMIAEIDKEKVRVLPLFRYIQKIGNISERDMFNTFNMGIGMMAIVPKNEAEKAIEILKEFNIKAYEVGRIAAKKESDEETIRWN